MKAISLLQPWASLVAVGAKRIETRSWPTKYRGPLAVHASKKDPCKMSLLGMEAFEAAVKEAFEKTGLSWCFLPTGCVIATCSLTDCKLIKEDGLYQSHIVPGGINDIFHREHPLPTGNELAFGDYTPGRYAWILSDVQKLQTPIPAKGRLGLWDWQEPEVMK